MLMFRERFLLFVLLFPCPTFVLWKQRWPHFREITFVKAHIKQANVLKQKGVCGNQELRL